MHAWSRKVAGGSDRTLKHDGRHEHVCIQKHKNFVFLFISSCSGHEAHFSAAKEFWVAGLWLLVVDLYLFAMLGGSEKDG